jgi:hypothetical protein
MVSSWLPDVNSIHKNYFAIRRRVAGKCKDLTYRGLIIAELDYKGFYKEKKKKTTFLFDNNIHFLYSISNSKCNYCGGFGSLETIAYFIMKP